MSSGQQPPPPPPGEGEPYGQQPEPPYGQPQQPVYQPGQPQPGQYTQPLYGQPPSGPPAGPPPPGQPPGGYPPQQGGYPYPPQPGYAQVGYAQPGYPPQKKSHTLRNVLLILLAILVLFFVGCSVLVGTVINKADKAIKTEVSRHAPTTVTPGQEFTHDGFRISGGWKIGKTQGINLATITHLKVTNEANGAFSSPDGRPALLTFRLYDDNTIVAEITCNGRQMQEGESSAMQCASGDPLPRNYNKIKVSDIFSGVATTSPSS
jgi:hypothetical protein